MLFCLQDFSSNTGSQCWWRFCLDLPPYMQTSELSPAFFSSSEVDAKLSNTRACWRKYSEFTNFFSDAPFAVMYLNFAYLGKFSGLNLSSWDTPCVFSRRSESSYNSMERVFPVKGTDIVAHVICCILHKLAVELSGISVPSYTAVLWLNCCTWL